MKKLILFIALFISYNTSMGQSWEWAKNFGSSDGQIGANICLDPAGNIYMTGDYGYPYGVFGTDTLRISGGAYSQLFISKMDNNGNIIWIKKAGGNNLYDNNSGGDIKYDPVSNSIYTTGYMDDSYTLGTCSVLGTSSGNIYLARFDTAGNCSWGIFLGGSIHNSSGGAIALDNYGNIYIYGGLNVAGTIGTFSVSAGGFIAKFNSSGVCLFAKNIFDTGGYNGNIKFFNSSLFISGEIQDSLIVIDTAHATNHGVVDNFIARFDTIGNIMWLRVIGGPNLDYDDALDIDGRGNIYTSGVFKDTIYLDTLSLINNFPVSDYLSKWDINGHIIWAKQITSASTSTIYTTYGYTYIDIISTDSIGYSYVTGAFNDTVNFGNGYVISTSDSSDTFIARYDSSGNCLGVINFGAAAGGDLKQDGSGAFYTTGSFAGTITLGSTSLSSTSGVIYLAKHDVITGLSEEDRQANNQLIIYANPTSGKCNITIPDEFMNVKNLTLSIFDNTGKIVENGNLEMDQGRIRLNLDAIAKGIYNVTLSNGKKSYNGRIAFQ